MGDGGANTRPRQPASQESKLHASAPTWVFCHKNAPIKVQSAETEEIAHRNVALILVYDPFWCAKGQLHINWLNLERFPL
ncbi:hypothetical protein C1X89_06095 [Pseudomonas sp. GP01-A8]|nr:hypothetical protein C1X90_06480 [Pseudomonas sp. GP01-A9]PMU31897.1 hypothetical protein C1X88_04350 [Pseudomonas sp. GP01-A13]PMU44096.1 hypothetical protein C1X89_06095 [Pseudomonas sp. GP01-A8]PMU47415.1 hypothetical protein C1X87_22585 [Pseudomonas sp. GP01-A14]PMU53634.1 hypothetical protein C1X85_15420 [Pseudomonas sp. GP01-A6]PMU64022.1 hypothetical protein C1X86_05350 [Pseudomonas sp. GP01-A3]PMU79285.1 hypothetical protein C1X81_02850 [Pseudomonas sp. FW215-L2]PMU79353.1 hypothe